MSRFKMLFSKLALIILLVMSLYQGVGQFIFKLVVYNDKLELNKSKLAFEWTTKFIPNNLDVFVGSLILLVIVFVFLEFRNDEYFGSKGVGLLKFKTSTFEPPRLVYKLIGVIVQLDFIYSSIVRYGVAGTGTKVSVLYGTARYKTVLSLLGGGAKYLGGGGIDLGYIVLTLLLIYILTLTFIIDNLINKLNRSTDTKASHNTTVSDIPM